MKVYNLKRGGGKTTRLLIISEYTGKPILCFNRAAKQFLTQKAKELHIDIPEPIAVEELHNLRGVKFDKEYIVDEVLHTLAALVAQASGGILTTPLAVSLSTEE